MTSSSIALPPYNPDLFVDREDKIQRIQAIIQQISDGDSDRPRAIVFRGERGSGKTWLALHLQRVVLPSIPNVTSLLLNFLPPTARHAPQENEWFIKTSPDVGQPDVDLLTRQIVQWVAEHVGATTAPEASLREQPGWLVRDVEQLFAERVLALILDSVFEADRDLLALLETHLFAPLAGLPRVLIIMTGRGRPYPWESPLLRVDVEDVYLPSFDVGMVEEQLRQQAPRATSRAGAIKDLGGGHPLSTFLLAQTPNPSDSLEMVAEALLDVVQPKERRRVVRDYFEALCLLDGFREDEIPPMLATYFDNPQYESWHPPQTREARDRLLETEMMRWEGGRFIIDESLRLALESLLRRDLDLWRRLHCRAYRLYEEWGRRYRKLQPYYEQRAARHAEALRHAAFDPQECPGHLEMRSERMMAADSALSGRSV
jgi:hypothetical protein